MGKLRQHAVPDDPASEQLPLAVSFVSVPSRALRSCEIQLVPDVGFVPIRFELLFPIDSLCCILESSVLAARALLFQSSMSPMVWK